MKRMKLLRLMSVSCLVVLLSANMAWSQDIFPRKITYNIVMNGSVKGTCVFSFSAPNTSKFLLRLKNFQGVGVASNDIITTYIFQEDLSLYTTFLERGKERVYEMLKTTGISALDRQERQVFIYEEQKSSGQTQTEVLSDVPVIDLLSSFVIASQKVAKRNTKAEQFNFFILKTTKLTDMVHQGSQNTTYLGRNVPADVMALEYQGNEMFQFHIVKDGGYTFPARVTIKDDKGGVFELEAAQVF